MFDYYKPTKAERRAILAGFDIVSRYSRSESDLLAALTAEQRGYGFANDRIPKIAAEALICKWVLDGAREPDMPASRICGLRPSAIFAISVGLVSASRMTAADFAALKTASAAHETAFERHMRVSTTAA
jgi:hypothetical protein